MGLKRFGLPTQKDSERKLYDRFNVTSFVPNRNFNYFINSHGDGVVNVIQAITWWFLVTSVVWVVVRLLS